MPTELPPGGDELETVARCNDAVEAQLLMNLLQSEGIPASLADAHLIQAYQLLSIAIGGVRVRVPARHVADAQRIIAAFEAGEYALDEDCDPGAPE